MADSICGEIMFDPAFDLGNINDYLNLVDSDNSSCESSDQSSSESDRKRKRTSKHVPHALQPYHKVVRRNNRERSRVQTVNSEFMRLRKLLPVTNRGKRISKENILKYAIVYIKELNKMIDDHDSSASSENDVVMTESPEVAPADESRRRQTRRVKKAIRRSPCRFFEKETLKSSQTPEGGLNNNPMSYQFSTDNHSVTFGHQQNYYNAQYQNNSNIQSNSCMYSGINNSTHAPYFDTTSAFPAFFQNNQDYTSFNVNNQYNYQININMESQYNANTLENFNFNTQDSFDDLVTDCDELENFVNNMSQW